MSGASNPDIGRGLRRRTLLGWSLGSAGVSLVGCGGGVDTGGTGGSVDTGGTGGTVGVFSVGPISGFGSIIVNGVRYDDSAARIEDDEGQPHRADELRLGMVVDVEAEAIVVDPADGSRSAKALTVRFGPLLRGPVETVDAAAGRFTALGQTVQIDAATVREGWNAGASIAPQDAVEVFGLVDAAGQVLATRVQRLGALSEYRLRGHLGALDTSARTLTIGGAVIGVAAVPAETLVALMPGGEVIVRLQAPRIGAQWNALDVRPLQRALPSGVQASVDGKVTQSDGAGHFVVDGVRVDASGSGVAFSGGSRAQLVDGMRVDVDGRLEGGVLVAASVTLHPTGATNRAVQLHGPIEAWSAAQRRLVVRGVAVQVTERTTFARGFERDLAVGVGVSVDGAIGEDGSTLIAARIKFDR